jgi:hypothetical protein
VAICLSSFSKSTTAISSSTVWKQGPLASVKDTLGTSAPMKFT